MKDKYLWYTDTHLDKVGPITKLRFLSRIKRENPKAIFLTGDISNGIMTCLDLKLLATWVKCPIYFVLGNHDYHFSSFEETHQKIRALCEKHPNLIWMTDVGVVPLTDEVAVIGAEGWYDASNGKPSYLKVTPDWFLIKDLRDLPTMEARIEAFKALADKACEQIEEKLETALALNYKTIYILTHVPPWKEATRNVGTIFENFWLPYNVNLRLGKTIEKVMQDRKKRNVTVLAGHVHSQNEIRVFRNIFCHVKNNGIDFEKIYA